MGTVEDCILGNGTLHDRFFATTEILAKLVSSAPRSVSIATLQEETGRPARELIRLCNGLARASLLRPDPRASDKWLLTCDASGVTLEDVFRCVLAEQQSRPKSSGKTGSERTPGDVDLLVMQAMIAINQSVFKHLRQFSLDRLKISSAGAFPAPRRPLRASLDDEFDVTLSGREASFVSPVAV